MSEAKKDEYDLRVLLCGCGKPARYTVAGNFEKGSCNKHMRCPTYAELQTSLEDANKLLSAYQVAVNKIDDYFEYSNESLKDRKKVHQILGNLTDEIKDDNQATKPTVSESDLNVLLYGDY